MMDEGQNEGRESILDVKPNKDAAASVPNVPVDKAAFDKHMLSQRKFHAEALREIESYLVSQRLISRCIALPARER